MYTCVCVCVCVWERVSEHTHSSSTLCDAPEFLAAAAAAAAAEALNDGDIKEELLQEDFIAIFHILCNRM